MIAALALWAAVAAAPASAPPSSSPVLAPTEKVGGRTQAMYTMRWWTWANRRRPGARPYQDPTGAQCGWEQSGPVWFLAGTDGTDRARRTCTVPADKHLLLPVIHMLAHSAPGKPLTCTQARAQAAANNEHLAQARVEIDGTVLEPGAANRVRSSECFDAFPDAPYLDSTASYGTAASDGYWLMLRPLAPGRHTIRVRARYANPGQPLGDLEQDFEYELDVVAPDTWPMPPDGPQVEQQGTLRT
jgi:hypothetical protein